MKYRFVDLVDIERFRVMMEAFYAATALPYGLIDTDNNILAGGGWQSICTGYHRVNPETAARCYESDHFIADHLRKAPFIGYRCRNGLMDYASPIVIEGEHVATMFTGQFFHEPPDVEFFRRQAQEFGFDEASYLEALAKVPVISQERAEAVMRFYAELAGMLTQTGLARLRQIETDADLAAANAGLAQRTTQLEASNKELEEFSYSMSHDMRTPLRAIDGFARILVEEHGDRLDDEGKRLLDVVRGNAIRMGRMIDDILRFLRMGRRKMAFGAVDVAKLARDAWTELRAARPTDRLRLEIGSLPPAWGDVEMIRLVVLNLLSNAIKFSRPGSDAAVEIGGAVGDGENTYYVRDRGIGFDMQYVGKLFKVFERVHATGQFEGSAIGLAIVKRIVDRHGGRIWAEGRVDEGAVFHFALPHRSE